MGAGVIGAPINVDSTTLATTGGTTRAINSWILVEEKILTAPADSLDCDTTLAGDTDKSYIIEWGATMVLGGVSFYLRLNGADGAGTTQQTISNNAAISCARIAQLYIGNVGDNANLYSGIVFFYQPTTRGVKSFSGYSYQAADNIGFSFQGVVSTPATATEITGIGITTDAVDKLAAGSYIRIWKRGV